LDDVFLQDGLDAVCPNYNVGLSSHAVREFQLRHMGILFEPNAAMSRPYRGPGKSFSKYPGQVCTVHSIDTIPAA
jgi:hypothetical protein